MIDPAAYLSEAIKQVPPDLAVTAKEGIKLFTGGTVLGVLTYFFGRRGAKDGAAAGASAATEDVRHQVIPNGGGNLHGKVDQILVELKVVREEQALQRSDIGSLQREFGGLAHSGRVLEKSSIALAKDVRRLQETVKLRSSDRVEENLPGVDRPHKRREES